MMRRGNQMKSTVAPRSSGRMSQTPSVDVYAVSLLSDEGDVQPTFHINLDDDDEDNVEENVLHAEQMQQEMKSHRSTQSLPRTRVSHNENRMSASQRRSLAGSTSSASKVTNKTSRASAARNNDSPQTKLTPTTTTIAISRRAYAAALLMKDSPIEVVESPRSLPKVASKPSAPSGRPVVTVPRIGTVALRSARATTAVGPPKVVDKVRNSSGVSSTSLTKSEDQPAIRNVRVIVRCCPSRTEAALLLRSRNEVIINPALTGKSEESRLGESDMVAPALLLATENNHVYKFDTVLGPSCDQKGAFDEVAVVVEKFLVDGVPGAILAYGQTATGKTHTMGLLPLSLQDSAGLGCIPRAVIRVFSQVRFAEISAMELYLDTVQDLLADPPLPVNTPHVKNDWDEPIPTVTSTLNIREKDGRFFVQGLRQMTCGSAAEAWEVIKRAIERRTTRETEMNAVSSRSHTIISISVNGRELSFVDLAGSERVRKCQGDVRETAFINSSLASLGNVVRALATSPSSFVPFRESKLTRLLQPSLSQGNAALFATVSMDPDNIIETLSTLKFAEKCTSLTRKLEAMTTEAVADEGLDERMCIRAGDRLMDAFQVLHSLANVEGGRETVQDWLRMEDGAFHAKLRMLEKAVRDKLQRADKPMFVSREDDSDMQSIFSPAERRKNISCMTDDINFDDPEAMYDLL